jgi:heterodisulfide reductase subunit C/nitrate reductase gamma subunit
MVKPARAEACSVIRLPAYKGNKPIFYTATLYISLAIFVFGFVYRMANWFRYKTSPDASNIATKKRISAALSAIVRTLFSPKLFSVLSVFVRDAFLQRFLLEKNFLRWLGHICLHAGFMLLLLMHGLDKLITTPLFDDYYPTLNPYMFLRDLFALVVLFGLGIVFYRRFLMKEPRPKTTGVDHYALIILSIIMISGVLLEGTKVVSHATYQEMVDEYAGLDGPAEQRALEAFWVSSFAVVSPNVKGPFDKEFLQEGELLHEMSCAECHSRPQWGFMGYGVAKVIAPIALPLDRANARTLLWYIHFMACFFGLGYLPFSKFFHIFATPIYLVASALVEKRRTDPANVATVEAMQFDACTHCGDCTMRCSVAVAYNEIPNPSILPSEKLAAFRTLLSGNGVSERHLMGIQEGSHICTDCHRCTDVCPVGINLEDLWLNLNSHLAERGYPRPEAWARRVMGTRLDLAGFRENGLFVTPGPKGFVGQLTGSAQASTFTVCFGCQTCTNVCPVVMNYDDPKGIVGLLPHEIMHALALKQEKLALGSNMLWDCVTCYMCQEHCPQGVRVTDVLYELKNLALRHLKEGVA